MASKERIFLDKSSAKMFPATNVRVIRLLSKVIIDIDVTNSSCLVQIIEVLSSDNE